MAGMIVLVTGASGFIGSRLTGALLDAGHEVICAVRHVPPMSGEARPVRFIAADFARDNSEEAWLPRVRGVDAVINAAGIIREARGQRFEAVHAIAPVALFKACVRAGVGRVIQISALGADAGAVSRYHLSKREADRHLATLPIAWTIVQPSLVYGPGGRSAQLFEALAAAPIVPLPGRGEQRVQPVHIDDVTSGILALLAPSAPARVVIPFVGPEPLMLRQFLRQLRAALGLGSARFVSIPLALVRFAARVGGWIGRGLLDTETLAMLERGNTADPTPFHRLLGRAPRPVADFVPPGFAAPIAMQARARSLLLVLRWSLALLWIVSGVVSFGLYPVEKSLALLARVGIEGPAAMLALYGAAVLDIALGAATVIAPSRRLWLAQMLLVVAYTLIISIWLPELWLEPFGPVLKNIPILAMLLLLHQLDRR